MANETGTYAVRVRHPGFITRFVRIKDCYPEDNINHWCHGERANALRLSSLDEANGLVLRLAAAFGSQGYRFDVMAERLVPQWCALEDD